jgi:hypothetical protein
MALKFTAPTFAAGTGVGAFAGTALPGIGALAGKPLAGIATTGLTGATEATVAVEVWELEDPKYKYPASASTAATPPAMMKVRFCDEDACAMGKSDAASPPSSN